MKVAYIVGLYLVSFGWQLLSSPAVHAAGSLANGALYGVGAAAVPWLIPAIWAGLRSRERARDIESYTWPSLVFVAIAGFMWIGERGHQL